MQTAVAGPMPNVQFILQIVDRIYAAACGEASWEQVLAAICRLGSVDGAALGTLAAVEPRWIPLASSGLCSRSGGSAWHRGVHGGTRLADTVLRSSPGTVLQGQITPDVLTAPRRLQEAAPVTGSVSLACVVVGKDERRVVCLEICRRERRAPGSPEPHELLRQLAPHLVRAWRLGAPSRPGPVMPSPVEALSLPQGDIARGADLARLPDAARLRTEFGLTKAEARLALRLAQGSSLASAAQAFDVKLSTIRSQLQQVFAKTGTSRQSELVAVLLSRGCGFRGAQGRPHIAMQAEAAFAG
jgi:DNA-binding CsgD family transcriptional regulator